jgi:hypothetical protein
MKGSLFMQYPQIGSILSNGYKVLANYKNKVVLAQHPNKEVPEPFAVWHLSPAGDTWGGHYSSDPETAEKWFARLCFDWLDEETAPEADVQERERLSYAEKHVQGQVLEEIYLRIIFEDVTISRLKKMKMLENLFSDVNSKYLRASHMEALEKIRCICKNAERYNMPVTYDDLYPAVVSHKNRNEFRSN